MKLYMITARGVEVLDTKGRTRRILNVCGTWHDIRGCMESRGYMLVIRTEHDSWESSPRTDRPAGGNF